MSCEEGLSASEGYAMESPAVCIASEGYEMEPSGPHSSDDDDDDDYDCDLDCCDGLCKKKLIELLLNIILLVLVCISVFLLVITGIVITKYFEGGVITRGVKVATDSRRLHVIVWLQGSRLESEQLFSVGASLTPETRRVASNSQSNAWKPDNRKAFYGTANEMLGKDGP